MGALQARSRKGAAGEAWDLCSAKLSAARELLAQKRSSLLAAGLRHVQEDVVSLQEETRDALEKLAAQNDRTGTRLDGLEEQVPRIEWLVVQPALGQFQYIYISIYNSKHIITSDYSISDSGSALLIVPSSEEQDVKLFSLKASGKTRKNLSSCFCRKEFSRHAFV